MEKKNRILVLLPSDVAGICRCSERTAQNKLQIVRMLYGKEKHQYVTVEEFSFYSGIPVKAIRMYLGDWQLWEGEEETYTPKIVRAKDVTSALAYEVAEPALAALHIRPNPVHGMAMFAFEGRDRGYVVLEIYGLNGKLIKKLFAAVAEAKKSYEFEVDLSYLSGGKYIYRAVTEGGIVMEKFTVER